MITVIVIMNCLVGVGVGHTGFYPSSFARELGKAYSANADDLSITMKVPQRTYTIKKIIICFYTL